MKPVAMLVLAFAGLSVPAAFAHPGSGLVVDAKGNVYFLPHYSARHSWMIYRVDPAGEVTVLVDDERLEERHDLFLDAEGQLVTATRGRVWRISPRGELSQIHPPASWTDFRPPQDDWTDPLVVANGGNPFAFDPRGNLYCARIGYGEPRTGEILRITPEGRVQVVCGGSEGHADGTGSAARFRTLHYARLLWGPDDRLYVGDGSALRRVTADGVVTTLAGGTEAGHVDGKGEAARFTSVVGMSFDRDGMLLVVDRDRIRCVTSDGDVSTLRGPRQAEGDEEGPPLIFRRAHAVARGPGGVLYVLAESGMKLLKVSPEGEVSVVVDLGRDG